MIITTADPVENIRALIDHCQQRRPKNGQGITLEDYGQYQDSAVELFRAYNPQTPEAADRLIETIYQLHPELRQAAKPELDYQPLPAEIPAFERQDNWLSRYVQYALKVSPMTPESFHEGAGLFLVSTAIARRLKVPMFFGEVYPNLFILWVAPTTLFRKTTALGVARKKASCLMPHLLTVQDATPEAMLADLAGREPMHFDVLREADKELWKRGRNFAAQKGWILDEISSLMANTGKDYNAGLTETLLRLFDCDESYSRSTRSQGLTIIKNAYLTLLGASTPGALSPHFSNKRLWSIGFWPRFAILTAEHRPEWREPEEAEEPQELTAGLERLLKRLPSATWPEQPQALTVTFAEGVYERWNHYNKTVSYDLLTDELDERLHGSYGRLPTQVIKVATILAALAWQDEPAPVIRTDHLAQAIAICEKWRASAHRALRMANENEFNVLQERIVKQLSKAGPKGATLRDVYKAMKDKTPDQIEDALRQLTKAGLVEEAEADSPKGGRPTLKFRLV